MRVGRVGLEDQPEGVDDGGDEAEQEEHDVDQQVEAETVHLEHLALQYNC